jgi:transcriptional regulator with XRE-family HTH domain
MPRQHEDLADFVRRTLKETGLSTRAVQDRARRKGLKITSGYVSRIVSRTVTNLTVNSLKALAAGLGVSEREVFATVLREPPSPEFYESDFATLYSKYKELSEADKKETRVLIKAIDREIEHRLKD